jgi:hypothetical protein
VLEEQVLFIQGLFSAEEWKELETVLVGVEAG